MEFNKLMLVRRLQSITQAGKTYSKDPFDLERYNELEELTSMLLDKTFDLQGKDPTKLLFNGAGYETPKIDIRGAIFSNKKILLVRDRKQQLWSLPRGWADTGYSSVENLEREFLKKQDIKS